MYFCPVAVEKVEFVSKWLSDGTEILFIQTVITEKVKQEIPRIPGLTFRSSKRAG